MITFNKVIARSLSGFHSPIKNAPTAVAIGAFYWRYYLVVAAAGVEDFFFVLCLWAVLCFFAFGALVDEVSPPVAGVSAAIEADARPKANTAAVIKVPDLLMSSPNGWCRQASRRIRPNHAFGAR
jgi:hypothetical protein